MEVMENKGVATVWVVVITAVFSLLLGAGGYYFYQQQGAKPTSLPGVAPPSSTATPPSPSSSTQPSSSTPTQAKTKPFDAGSDLNLELSFDLPIAWNTVYDANGTLGGAAGSAEDSEWRIAADKIAITIIGRGYGYPFWVAKISGGKKSDYLSNFNRNDAKSATIPGATRAAEWEEVGQGGTDTFLQAEYKGNIYLILFAAKDPEKDSDLSIIYKSLKFK